MNIIEAVAYGGTKIRRSAWVIKNNYIRHMNNDHFLDENDKWYMLSREDAISSDWELYEEPKTYTFQEALRAFNEGKNIKRPERTYWFNRKHDYEYEEIFTLRDVNATDWIIE